MYVNVFTGVFQHFHCLLKLIKSLKMIFWNLQIQFRKLEIWINAGEPFIKKLNSIFFLDQLYPIYHNFLLILVPHSTRSLAELFWFFNVFDFKTIFWFLEDQKDRSFGFDELKKNWVHKIFWFLLNAEFFLRTTNFFTFSKYEASSILADLTWHLCTKVLISFL